MRDSRRVIMFSVVSLLIYIAVSLKMYSLNGTKLNSAEVLTNIGIATGLYIVAIVLDALNMRFSIYPMLFVIFTYSIALINAFWGVNVMHKTTSIDRLLVDALSIVGMLFSVLTILYAGRQRELYRNIKNAKGSKR